MNQIGYYGKIPEKGDFIRFNLPQIFIQVWDDWLQQVILHGQSNNPEWDEQYKQGKPCRFIFSAGIAGRCPWLGIMSPSTDKTGRQFPFCIAVSLDDNAAPLLNLVAQSAWLDQSQRLLSDLVTGEILSEQLDHELRTLAEQLKPQLALPSALQMLDSFDNFNWIFQNDQTTETEALSDTLMLTAFIDPLLIQTLGEYSGWISASTPNRFMLTAGLPGFDQALSLFGDKTVHVSTCHVPSSVPDLESPSIPIRSKEQHDPPPLSPTAEPSQDDWAALEAFSETNSSPAAPMTVEPLELDEDDTQDAPWEK